MLKTFNRILDRLEEIIVATLIAAATIVVFFAVVHRYGIGYEIFYPFLSQIHISWAQELCIYMLVWMAKFGAAYGVRTGIHVGVDVLINQLSDRWRRGVILFGLFSGALFTFIVGTFGARFVWLLSFTNQVTPDLEMPKWIVYLAVPLGSYLMCYRFLQVAWSFWRTGHLPHHDETDDLEGLDELHPHDVVGTGSGSR